MCGSWNFWSAVRTSLAAVKTNPFPGREYWWAGYTYIYIPCWWESTVVTDAQNSHSRDSSAMLLYLTFSNRDYFTILRSKLRVWSWRTESYHRTADGRLCQIKSAVIALDVIAALAVLPLWRRSWLFGVNSATRRRLSALSACRC